MIARMICFLQLKFYKPTVVIGLMFFRLSLVQKYLHNITIKVSEFHKVVSDTPNSKRFVSQTLFYLFMSKWLSRRMRDIFNCTKAHNKYVLVEGKNKFIKAQKTGNGIIIVASHYGLIESIPAFITSMGVNECLIYSRTASADFLLGFKNNPSIRTISLNDRPNNHYQDSINVLKNNGVVVIFADGLYGRKELKLEFLGKIRGFKVGFAKLAYYSGAIVLPVVPYLDERGNIIIKINDKLRYDVSSDYNNVERSLITQYVDVLQTIWQKDYSHVLYQHQKFFLSCKGS